MTRPEILELFQTLHKGIAQAIVDDEGGHAISQGFDAVFDALNGDMDYGLAAETLLTNMITYYPNLTPAIPRELLWSIGGSCLHFMEDDEIDRFSEQDTDFQA